MDAQQTRLLNVLLVEDNAVDARMISALLRTPSTTLHCRQVASLSDALALLRSEQFDVVLLDLNLEDSAGYDTFSSIRQAGSRAAILVLSGSDDEELAIRTVREGAQDYLVKGSFDGRLLLRSVRYAFERKRSEDALRRSETTVRAIFENSLDGIVIFEDSGFCLEANVAAAALLDVAREGLLGHRLCDFVSTGFGEEWQTLRESESGRGQFWIQLQSGGKRLVDYCFRANILPGKHLSMLRDVTEQHGMEEQLRQSQKMEAVGRLAGGVAHDFNNILGIISGYAELLQMNSKFEAERTRAEKIISATEKAASLTRQLLAFGRKQVMSLELIDLSLIVKDLTSMLDCLMSAAAPIEVRIGKDLGLVKADQSQLEQVILNLTANARDAMPNGGALTITVASYVSPGIPTEIPPGEYVHLAVSDTGIGMSEEIQSRVFEPFFTTKKTGYGLGLSTVYGIIKQSSGYITVQSALQVGSTFHIYLPVVVAGSKPKRAVVEESKPVDHRGHETILLVDDEDDLRSAACEYLEGCGYQVLIARNGKEAIEVSDGHKGVISLLISDIVMPKLNGRAVVEHVTRTRPGTSILVVSGYADDAVLRHGILLGANCFLQKPFTFQALGAKIRTLLDGPVVSA